MNTTAILILLVSFAVMIVIGFHISYSMMAASLTILYLGLSPTQIINTMVDGVDGFTFLAIPFFILSGDIMARGGISDRLILLADALVGWMRGGLAMVNIVASIFFGGISGSASADTASLGAILIPMMDKQGYDKEFATAVTMTSSVQGMLIPPSHNMIIYAMAAGGISVSALFMAGLVPGVFLGIALMVFCYYLSVKRNYPKGTPFTLHNLRVAVRKSIWGLGTVIIVVVGVVMGIFTGNGERGHRLCLCPRGIDGGLPGDERKRPAGSRGKQRQDTVHGADPDRGVRSVRFLHHLSEDTGDGGKRNAGAYGQQIFDPVDDQPDHPGIGNDPGHGVYHRDRNADFDAGSLKHRV